MNKTTENSRIEARDDDVIVLGNISIETKGADGVGEPIGRLMLPGIAED